jgi:isoleucyl-tRNA synthetase
MLAPILAFTCEEAWEVLHKNEEESTLYHTYYKLPNIENTDFILNNWQLVYDFRSVVLKELENKRVEGIIGSSLQAFIKITANKELYPILSKLGSDLKFAYMVSNVELIEGSTNNVEVIIANTDKCERCWHYSESVGKNKNYLTICNRCIDNLFGNGELRKFA